MDMTREERSILEALDRIVRSKEMRTQIKPIVERVCADLCEKLRAVIQPSHKTTARLMTWEPIPLATFGSALPAEIRSSWVFVLRAGTNTGAERHPNSHQRMMSWEGTGDLQTEDQRSEVRSRKSEDGGQILEIKWQSNVLVSDAEAPRERRWISIPPKVWHRPVIPRQSDWVVISFHTVPAEELIEERPDDQAPSGTKRKTYLSKN
jgi:hypothetical protein